METKWIVIGIVGWLAVMFGGLAYSEHVNNQCKIAAIERGMSVSDIAALCKK